VHTTFLLGGLKGERPLGRPRRRWEDNINMDLGEIWFWGCGLIWLRTGTDDELL
jgi:hypothetical protein